MPSLLLYFADEQAPALTVRVCDGLSCEMHGAQSLMSKLQTTLTGDVRVIHAPCVNPTPRSTSSSRSSQIAATHQMPASVWSG